MTRGTANSCFEQRDDEVVLVVAGCRDDDVAALEPGLLQRRDLARVADVQLDAVDRRELGGDVRVALDEQDVVAVLDERVRDEAPDIPGTRYRDAHQWLAASSWPLKRAWSASTAVTSIMICRTSPSWPTRSGSMTRAAPSRVTAATMKRPGSSSFDSRWPAHAAGRSRSTRETLPLESVQSAGCSPGQQPTDHLVGRPRDGGDRRDAEPLVDRSPARVVDAGDDPLDLEGLAGDPGRHDVRVVAAGHRRQRTGLLDAGLLERVAVEAEADDPVAAEAGRQAPERVLALVDDRDGVTLLLEGAGQLTTYPAAPHHDDMHPALHCSRFGPARW